MRLCGGSVENHMAPAKESDSPGFLLSCASRIARVPASTTGHQEQCSGHFSNPYRYLTLIDSKNQRRFGFYHKTCLTLPAAPLRKPLTNGAHAASERKARV